MTSHQAGGSGHVYGDQSRLPVPKPQLNGKQRTPSSSSGAASRASKSTSNTKDSALFSPSPRPGLRSAQSELTTSFDPTKDMHLWTMWRVAVNGRIMDDVRKRNHAAPPPGDSSEHNPYGRALVKTPLDRFVRMENGSKTLASLMMDPHGDGGSELETKQFVFYGVPRVVLKKSKHTVNLPGDPQ